MSEEEGRNVGRWENEKGGGGPSVLTAPLLGLFYCRSQITIHLKEKCTEFAKPARVKEIIKKYSNFVNFPIKVHPPLRRHAASPCLSGSSCLSIYLLPVYLSAACLSICCLSIYLLPVYLSAACLSICCLSVPFLCGPDARCSSSSSSISATFMPTPPSSPSQPPLRPLSVCTTGQRGGM